MSVEEAGSSGDEFTYFFAPTREEKIEQVSRYGQVESGRTCLEWNTEVGVEVGLKGEGGASVKLQVRTMERVSLRPQFLLIDTVNSF